jgi:hypothetical protein
MNLVLHTPLNRDSCSPVELIGPNKQNLNWVSPYEGGLSVSKKKVWVTIKSARAHASLCTLQFDFRRSIRGFLQLPV